MPGTWVHQTNGDSHPGEEIKEGGVRMEFIKGEKGSRTPWNLKFWAPRQGHLTHDTISGGCGFYDEVHDGMWRTAFCRGYGLKVDKGLELKLILERNDDLTKLRVQIGATMSNIIDEVLIKQ